MPGVISEGSAADPQASEDVMEDAISNKSIRFQTQLYRVFCEQSSLWN